MLEKQVEDVMRSALLSCSKSNKIDLKDLRIKMKLSKEEDSTFCILVNKLLDVEELSWSKILGIKVFFKSVIVNTITKGLKNVAKNNNIDLQKISVRVYAIDQTGKPAMYLYNGGTPVKELNLNEILQSSE